MNCEREKQSAQATFARFDAPPSRNARLCKNPATSSNTDAMNTRNSALEMAESAIFNGDFPKEIQRSISSALKIHRAETHRAHNRRTMPVSPRGKRNRANKTHSTSADKMPKITAARSEYAYKSPVYIPHETALPAAKHAIASKNRTREVLFVKKIPPAKKSTNGSKNGRFHARSQYKTASVNKNPLGTMLKAITSDEARIKRRDLFNSGASLCTAA